MELRTYLQSEIELTQDMITTLDDLFTYKEYPKYHTLLSNGDRSTEVFFIEKGLVRMFYYKDGKDITDHFFKEDIFFCSVENVYLNEKNPYNYELLEKSTIRSINYSLLVTYLNKIPKLNDFNRVMMAYSIKKLCNRIYDIQFQSAENRYQALLEESPDLILRAPLGDIASYLGITQQTLSVIRAGIKLGK